MAEFVDHYCVMGNPISHSLSPRIHSQFARQTAQSIDYVAIEPARDQFIDAVQDFYKRGGKGLNVTVPFKQQAWAMADRRTDIAQRAGAANTLWFDGEHVCADNTDGKGLVRDLVHNLCLSLQDKSILVLGAGGAVRGILEPLLNEQPEQCVIANRTHARAVELVSLFSSQALKSSLTALEFSELQGMNFDLIINGTSASLQGDVPPLPADLLNSDGGCYDMMYSRQPTVFLQWAEANNAAFAVDGLGMLVEQAAEAFDIWRGVRPETRELIAALKV